jgi:hypothetical protein
MNLNDYSLLEEECIFSLVEECFDPYNKGYLFEKYIQRLFSNQGRFEFIYFNHPRLHIYGREAAKATFPDLKVLFHSSERTYKFAIECKWSKSLGNGNSFIWVQPDTLKRYQLYQKIHRIPVFIAIGVAGEASNPERLYVTHLDHFGNRIQITENEMIPFKRKANRKFFYDAKQLKLF